MKLITATTAIALLLAAPTYAGGPVITEDETEVVAPAPKVNILPVILIVLIACAALCGGDDDEKPVKECKTAGGC